MDKTGAGRGESIMVVDDSPENLQVLGEMLRRKGYDVRLAPNGKFALSAVAGDPPDLILLDIHMPGMDGYEVCRALKGDDTLRKIPVLFISGLDRLEDKMRAFEAGGIDYVTKPFQFEEVDARVRTHLELRRLQTELERHNLRLEQMVEEQVKEISDSQMAIIFALAKLSESRDDETGHHMERVRETCRILAAELLERGGGPDEINPAFVQNIYLTSPLHDIGKVGIPDAVLLKPGKLSAEEFEVMKSHTVIGAQTLEAVHHEYPHAAFVRMGIDVARSHHERWDGTGYPDRLAGPRIPVSAQITAVADVYDALRSERHYKEAFSHEKSREIILGGAGGQFSPQAVRAFEMAEAKIVEVYERLRG